MTRPLYQNLEGEQKTVRPIHHCPGILNFFWHTSTRSRKLPLNFKLLYSQDPRQNSMITLRPQQRAADNQTTITTNPTLCGQRFYVVKIQVIPSVKIIYFRG